MILDTYITLICNAAEPCLRIVALLLALILVFDTNSGASNASGPEDLPVVLLLVPHCGICCVNFGALVMWYQIGVMDCLKPKMYVLPNSGTQNSPILICDEIVSFNRRLVLHLAPVPAWAGPMQLYLFSSILLLYQAPASVF